MKARLPKGYGSGGANNIQQLARQAQKLQDDMEAASKELETKEYEATAGGGAVKVTVTGKMELTKVEISPEVVDPEDVEMLSDLVMAAANEAIRAAAKEKEDKIGPLLRPYLSPQISVAIDAGGKIFTAFGVQYVPFGVLVDSKNRALWQGNSLHLTPEIIDKSSK